jgi:hypothetical protein
MGVPMKSKIFRITVGIFASILLITGSSGAQAVPLDKTTAPIAKASHGRTISTALPKPFFTAMENNDWLITLHWKAVNFGNLDTLTGYEITVTQDCPPVTIYGCPTTSWQASAPQTNIDNTVVSDEVHTPSERSATINLLTSLDMERIASIRIRALGTITNSDWSSPLKITGPRYSGLPVAVTAKFVDYNTLKISWSKATKNPITNDPCGTECDPNIARYYVDVVSEGTTSDSKQYQTSNRYLVLSNVPHQESILISIDTATAHSFTGDNSSPTYAFSPSLPTSPTIWNCDTTATNLAVFYQHNDIDPNWQSFTPPESPMIIEISDDSTFAHIISRQRLPLSSSTFTFRGLKSNTDYSVRMAAVSPVGQSAWETCGATTKQLPGAITNLVTIIHPGTVDLEWVLNQNGDFPVTGFSIQYSLNPDYSNSHFLKTSTNHATISNLSKGHGPIYLQIRAKSEGGDGPITPFTIIQ